MRLTRCRLLRYQALQHRWRATECRSLLPTVLRTPRLRGRPFSFSVLHRGTTFVGTFSAQSLPDAETDCVVEEDESLEETATDILTRAKAYNIQTLVQLSFESRLKTTASRGPHLARLVDHPPYKTDFYLWSILLDYQKLKNGDRGVRLIWEGLKQRSITDLPYVGYQGDRLWSAFVSTGCRNLDLLTEIVRFELRHGSKRPRFFLEVVGTLLNSEKPHSAKAFARRLQAAHRPETQELYELFVLATAPRNPEVLQIFCEIYAALMPRDLYSRAVSYLCTHKRLSDAWMMHRFLLSHEDLPQTFEDIQPLILDLVNNHMRLELFLHELAKAGVSMKAQANSFYSQEASFRGGFASENLNIVAGNTLGIRPRTMSDEFAARAFMTATFAFDSVLSGLRFFGLRVVGPSSIRAIGLTSADSQELTARFAKLAANEIDTGSSRFSRVVKKLAADGKEKALQDVLHSDQHADVVEDLRLQRRLLFRYYKAEDWSDVERTLAILTVGDGSNESTADTQAKNFLLQAALIAGKWSHVRSLVADMKDGNHSFTEASIARMYGAILSIREPSRLPVSRGDFDEVGFVSSLWLEVLQSGSRFPITRWREILRRLGMCGRLDELEKLLFQLLHFYDAGHPSGVVATTDHGRESIDQLLSPDLQSAIVAWGFIHGRHLWRPAFHSRIGGLKRLPWGLRGVSLLRRLKDEHCCNIDVKLVRQACLVRLRQLFNYRTESILVRNRRHRVRNKLSLMNYYDALNIAWKEPLFSDRAWLLNAVTIRAPILARQLRRVAVRQEFGSHEPRRDLATHKPLTNADVALGQDEKGGKMPGGVVIYGGPLSQAYWSQDNGKSRP